MNDYSFSINIRSGDRLIVSIDDFTIYSDDITFLFGESGIGKSIITKTIYGLLDPDDLDIEINGRDYSDYVRDKFTEDIMQNSFFVFQEPSSHLNPLLKITSQLNEGSLKYAKNEEGFLKYLWQTDDSGIINGIVDVFPKPYRPSGGEKQRILLTMAFKKIELLLNSSEIIPFTFFVFDEPTGSLDNNYRNLFLNLLLHQYCQKPFTVLLITHDYSMISEVYNKHRQILNRIHFKELSRTRMGRVHIHDFSPNEYLSWLHKTEYQHQQRETKQQNIILDIKHSYSIFNQNYTIYKDPQHSIPGNLIIKRGEIVYIKAPSGMGKTSLAKAIMGLLRPQKIDFSLCGIAFSEKTPESFWQKKIWGKRAGMVFQHADESLNLMASVKETFSGLHTDQKLTSDTLRSHIMELFDNEIDDDFLQKKVAFLSGGQKQRLNLLRTLIMDTDLIILDEPLNGLDFISIKKVLQILEEKRKRGSAFLLISHNEEIFDNFVDRQYIYYLG
ncbi:MAG: ATP-binding cassette domain-containing protein [Chitinispirillia bacterium]|jgi:ABC-type dipeptide/oligopeptide/nickel transport system ATPase subunit